MSEQETEKNVDAAAPTTEESTVVTEGTAPVVDETAPTTEESTVVKDEAAPSVNDTEVIGGASLVDSADN